MSLTDRNMVTSFPTNVCVRLFVGLLLLSCHLACLFGEGTDQVSSFPKLMPLVGKASTFSGKLSFSKSGWVVVTNCGPVFVIAPDDKKNEALNDRCVSLKGREVLVSGCLNRWPFRPARNGTVPSPEMYWVSYAGDETIKPKPKK